MTTKHMYLLVCSTERKSLPASHVKDLESHHVVVPHSFLRKHKDSWQIEVPEDRPITHYFTKPMLRSWLVAHWLTQPSLFRSVMVLRRTDSTLSTMTGDVVFLVVGLVKGGLLTCHIPGDDDPTAAPAVDKWREQWKRVMVDVAKNDKTSLKNISTVKRDQPWQNCQTAIVEIYGKTPSTDTCNHEELFDTRSSYFYSVLPNKWANLYNFFAHVKQRNLTIMQQIKAAFQLYTCDFRTNQFNHNYLEMQHRTHLSNDVWMWTHIMERLAIAANKFVWGFVTMNNDCNTIYARNYKLTDIMTMNVFDRFEDLVNAIVDHHQMYQEETHATKPAMNQYIFCSSKDSLPRPTMALEIEQKGMSYLYKYPQFLLPIESGLTPRYNLFVSITSAK